MQMVAFEGSPRSNGNTETLTREVLKGAEDSGASSRFFKLVDLDIQPCRGCSSCRPTGQCVIDDDMDEAAAAIQDCGAVLLASPIYMWQVTGTMKNFMDRLVRFLRPDFSTRLNGPKKLTFVYTQGNPENRMFEPYFDYLENLFSFLQYDVQGRLLAVGTRAPDDICRQPEILKQARELGTKLVR